MIELQRSPWQHRFNRLIERTDASLLLCAPYIGRGPCESLSNALTKKGPIDVYILTDLSRDNMLSGATDVAAIAAFVASFPKTQIRFLPSLHAKIYVSDSREAIVTSANLTDNGLCRNFEYGVVINESTEVEQVRGDLLNYGDLGSPVALSQLQAFAEASKELRSYRLKTEASLKRALREEFSRKLLEMDEHVLRTRAGDRSLSAILSDAILYLLKQGPMPTPEIHKGVQRIHPDLCDDSVDRVINGVHFGKKWKHAVRNAQNHLKERGRIGLFERKWKLLSTREI